MDANTIITMIGSLGFPIVACIGMAYFFTKINENYRQDVKELGNMNKAEIDKLTEAVNNNTIALTKLVEKLDREV